MDATLPQTLQLLSFKRALIIFALSILAMSVGWLLGAYIPLWLAPPDENLGNTFLLYMLLPCVLWGVVPFLLFRYWQLPRNADTWIYWIARYIMLFAVWLIVLLLVFNRGYGNNVFFEMTVEFLARTTCTSETAEDGHIIYTCKGGLSGSSTCAEEDYIIIYGGFDAVGLGCPNYFTFEGRDGLPFVWYTGEVTPTPEVEND